MEKNLPSPGYDDSLKGIQDENNKDEPLKVSSDIDEKLKDLQASRAWRHLVIAGFFLVSLLEIMALPIEIQGYWRSALDNQLFIHPPKGLLPMMGVTLAVLAAVPLTIFLSLSNLIRPSYQKDENTKDSQGVVTLAQSIVTLLSDLAAKIANLTKK